MTAAHEVLPKPSLLSMLSSDGGGAGLQRRVSQLFFLVVLTGITIATVCSQSLVQADPHRFATVPALAVSASDGKEIGAVHYISDSWDLDNPKKISEWKQRDPNEVWTAYFFHKQGRPSAAATSAVADALISTADEEGVAAFATTLRHMMSLGGEPVMPRREQANEASVAQGIVHENGSGQ